MIIKNLEIHISDKNDEVCAPSCPWLVFETVDMALAYCTLFKSEDNYFEYEQNILRSQVKLDEELGINVFETFRCDECKNNAC
jgi:hypothetical protein